MNSSSFVVALALAFSLGGARADVRMPAIFGDHMVLQQQAKLPVWGWAAPGEKVTVSFAGESADAVAAADGTWRVELAPVAVKSDGQVLTVAGQNTLTFQDVLVGDVWLVSGQSNMEFGIQEEQYAATEIPKANDPQLRFFFVPWSTSLQPNTDFANAPANSLNGKWQVCTPEVMSAQWGWHGFSAIGYYFGKELRSARNQPIGLIAAYKGGTPAQSWTSISGLQKDPVLGSYLQAHQKLVDGYDQAKSEFPAKNAAFQAVLKEWTNDAASAKAAGTAFTKPRPPSPTPADGGFGAPGNLFNGMIAPLIPFAIKGVVWYQGESNANNPAMAWEYGTLFPRLITDWREKWGQGDFPFLYIELANFKASKDPANGSWPWLRDAQRKTLSLPATGMATAIDVGNPTYIHPADKRDVGQRLALVARHVAYGEPIVSTGPAYQSMTVEGNKIRITLANADGLAIGLPPWNWTGVIPPAPATVTGFLIAGADYQFVPADAQIDGQTVVVSSPSVSAPAAVRYDWSDNPDGDLYNKEHLPAFSFRTDDGPPAALPASH